MEVHNIGEKLDKLLDHLSYAEEERKKAKVVKAAQDKVDKENATANMKQLSDALLLIPLSLKASADHLKVAADQAEAAIRIFSLPVPPSSTGSSSSAAGPPASAGPPPSPFSS